MGHGRDRHWVAVGVLLCGSTWLSAQPGGQAPTVTRQPVYIEDSPAAQDLADQATQLRDEGRFAEAVQRLQRVVDEYPYKLMPKADGSFTDAVLWVRAEIKSDQRMLGAYRALFGPAAQRQVALAMPTPASPIDTTALQEVLTRYTLTRAGLDAGLALGAYHLERAAGRDASGVLDELTDHPDLPSQAGRYHFQRALAGLLLSDTAGYETHRQALEDLADTSHLAELEALANRTHPPLRFQHDPEGPAATGSNLPTTLDRPLWEIKYTEGFTDNAMIRPNLRGVPPGVSLLRVIPGGDTTRVYLNLGDKVTAYDRASGWRLWEAIDRPDPQAGAAALGMPRGLVAEPRGVLVSAERVFALVGWMNPRQNLPAQAKGGVSLLGIDAETGRELWRVRADQLDQALERASFDGTPIGGDGRIYTLVKRVQVSGLHDLYITAVNQADGQMLWRRHISSSSTQGNYNTGPAARMLLHGGRVYVADNRGTVCALDGRTGTARWLTLLPEAGFANPSGRRVAMPIKDHPAPVLVQAGLLVPPFFSSNKYVLLDANTGMLVRQMAGSDWRGVQACYAAGRDVLGIGGGVTCFDGRTLVPRWQTTLEEEKYGPVLGRAAVDLDMGSASTAPHSQAPGVTANALPSRAGVVVLNTEHRMVALSLTDGEVLADPPVTSPGNVMLAPGQVVVASADTLYGFTDWLVAHDQLTSQATNDPSDPQPGLALARLALRIDREPAVLEGVDVALSSLSEPLTDLAANEARQRRVFGLLREIIDPSSGAGVELRGEMLDRIASAAATPGQEVAYQLTRGLYLQEIGQPGRAVEHYQAVLADRSLASELYTLGRGSRRAGLEAQRLLKALIETNGRDIYRPYDLLAEHELDELNASGVRDPQRYTDLADRYPLALSANDTRLIAADIYHEAGMATAALRQWQAVYLDTESMDRLSDVAGRIVQLYLREDRPDLARRWLRRVNREHPGLVLVRDDQPVSIPSWLSELGMLLSADRPLPRIDLPLSEPKLIPGRPMIPSMTGGDPPRDRVLMRDDRSIWMMSSPGFENIWHKPLPAPDMRALAIDDRQVLWWSQQDGILGGVDSATGEPLWPKIDLARELEQTGDASRRLQLRTRQQMEFVQLLGGAGGRNPRANPGGGATDTPLTAVDLTTIIIADRFGRIVCIDRHTGLVRWRRLSASDNLTSLTIGDGLVAIGGASWADTQVQNGVVALLDVLTGEPLETRIQSEQVPAWLGFADNGLLVMVGNGRLSAHDPATGRTEWRRDLPRLVGVRRAWLGGRMLIVSTQQAQVGSALAIDVDNGEVVNQLAIRTVLGQARAFDAFLADGRWQLISPMQAVALSPSGRTRWADAVCAPLGHMLLQLVGESYVCIIGQTGTQQVPILPGLNVAGRPELEKALREAAAAGHLRVGAGGYRLYLLDRKTGSIVSDTPLGGVPGPIDPAASVLLNGAMMLGVGDQTLVIQPKISAD